MIVTRATLAAAFRATESAAKRLGIERVSLDLGSRTNGIPYRLHAAGAEVILGRTADESLASLRAITSAWSIAWNLRQSARGDAPEA